MTRRTIPTHPRHAALVLGLAVLGAALGEPAAWAQPPDAKSPPAASGPASSREASTIPQRASRPAPPAAPHLTPPPAPVPPPPSILDRVRQVSFFENKDWGVVIRPIIRLAGGINHQLRTNEGQAGVAQEVGNRVTSVAILQFGLTGQLFRHLTFYSEFERNLGSYGTSVWNDGAALQARLNYLEYSRWGVSLAAGIIGDPASMDYVSAHVLDVLGRDSNVASGPFFAGLNMSQGVMLRYAFRNIISIGLTYTASNPLATTLSYGFGGKVAEIGNIFFLATKTEFLGDPGSDAEIQTLSPGFVLHLDLPHIELELKGVAQFFFVDVDTTASKDVPLRGYNLKGSLKLGFLRGMIQPFVNGNYRRNEMLVQAIPIDTTTKANETFVGWTIGGGIDVNYWKKNGVGAYYCRVQEEPGLTDSTTRHYINVGTTFWIIDDLLAAGARYAKQILATKGNTADGQVDFDSYFITMRLVLN